MKFLQWGILIFSIAFSASISSAQTIVCSGDSVVLILNGYKQGSTVWQKSLDLTSWYTPQGGTDYNDSLVIIVAQNSYYRAKIIDGTCSPIYSDTVQVIIGPTAKPATNVTQTSFIANWSAFAGATDYYLDVALDAAFKFFVAGKRNIHVIKDTAYSIAGLICNTAYYYRVKTYSKFCDTSCSNTITVTTNTCPTSVECELIKSTCSGNITDTRDDKTYKTVQIGSQCWMAQNLNVGKRIDGIMPQTQVDSVGVNTIEKYCYGDNEVNCTTYGGLYMWDEMMSYESSVTDGKGPQGICPTGWHVPTDKEWTCLENTLGGATTAGGKLKDTIGWTPWSTVTTNSSGFTALPGGARNRDGSSSSGGKNAHLWTATEYYVTDAWYRVLDYTNAQSFQRTNTKVYYGYSVRCVKN